MADDPRTSSWPVPAPGGDRQPGGDGGRLCGTVRRVSRCCWCAATRRDRSRGCGCSRAGGSTRRTIGAAGSRPAARASRAATWAQTARWPPLATPPCARPRRKPGCDWILTAWRSCPGGCRRRRRRGNLPRGSSSPRSLPGQAVVVDKAEVHDHAGWPPAEALARRDRGEIALAPPTWMTLHWLAQPPTSPRPWPRLGPAHRIASSPTSCSPRRERWLPPCGKATRATTTATCIGPGPAGVWSPTTAAGTSSRRLPDRGPSTLPSPRRRARRPGR